MSKISLNPTPTFEADVALSEPGQAEPVNVAFVFKHKGRKDLDAFVKLPVEREASGNAIKDPEYLADIVVGWPGVDAEFTPENFATFLEARPTAGQEIYRAYLKNLTQSRVKN